MISALNRKLLRDLWRLKGQVVAVSLVVASGVGVLVMSLTALESLQATAEAYYERYRFAHVFAGAKRAPERLAREMVAIPGVQAVETRISQLATLDLPDFAEPVMARLISVPERGAPRLNRLAMRAGRWVAPGRPDEIVLSEPFALAHDLTLGSRFEAIINGHRRQLEVVGIALSPEFVYAIGPGSLMPDDRRFGIGWMGRRALAAAFDLDGAFNDVSLTLLRGVDPAAVLARVDAILERYGGTPAIARADQISNWFLMNELDQLKTVSTLLPAIFLAVAGFLTNMVLARIIATERAEIGLMKAFGYSNRQVAWHYVQMVIAMTAVGIALGALVGTWLGRINTEIYSEFYRFPFLYFRPTADVYALGALISLAVALSGTAFSVRRAAMLPPAVAMQPPAPPAYRRGGLSGTRLLRHLDHPTRIILRQIERWPLRSALTSVGVGLSVGVLVMANQWIDSIDAIAEEFFFRSQHQDVMVGLVEPQSTAALYEFRRMPGVLAAEPLRIVSADFRVDNRRHRGAVEGVEADARLHHLFDADGAIVSIPPEGLVMSTVLAQKLGVGIGDHVWLELREGRRPVREVRVVRLFETMIGMPAYMDARALDELLLERPSLEYVNLLVDPLREQALFAQLKASPEVSAVMKRRAAVETFHDTLGDTLLVYVAFFTGFAVALGFGVVYNSARVALSERAHELATLRVLGFSRGEIAYILLGEVVLLTVVALPLGCLMGRGLARVMTAGFETELYRVPLVVDDATYGTAVVLALVAAAVSAALVGRRVAAIDLVSALKSRE